MSAKEFTMSVKVLLHAYNSEKYLSNKEHKFTRMPSVGEYVKIDEEGWFRVEIVTHWTLSEPELEDNSWKLSKESSIMDKISWQLDETLSKLDKIVSSLNRTLRKLDGEIYAFEVDYSKVLEKETSCK